MPKECEGNVMMTREEADAFIVVLQQESQYMTAKDRASLYLNVLTNSFVRAFRLAMVSQECYTRDQADILVEILEAPFPFKREELLAISRSEDPFGYVLRCIEQKYTKFYIQYVVPAENEKMLRKRAPQRRLGQLIEWMDPKNNK